MGCGGTKQALSQDLESVIMKFETNKQIQSVFDQPKDFDTLQTINL
jgi:hypothetical protein